MDKEYQEEFLNEQLHMQGIKFERAHRSCNRNDISPWTIKAKFITYKAKEHILCKSTFLKGAIYFLNENFSEDTQSIRKRLKKSKRIERYTY